jgi:hypothetical protein
LPPKIDAGLGTLTFIQGLIPSWAGIDPDSVAARQQRRPDCPTIACLKRPDKLHHATALCCVGYATACGTDIVRHVGGVGRAWDDCRDGWIANQILQEELCPAGGVNASRRDNAASFREPWVM